MISSVRSVRWAAAAAVYRQAAMRADPATAGWGFDVFRLSSDGLSYADEVRRFARAHVLVSLFGSALTNCVFMANSSLVVEIHAALKNDYKSTYLYRHLCERSDPALGVRWAGFAPEGFLAGSANASADAAHTAHVPPPAFARFFGRALRGELQPLAEEYAAAVAHVPHDV